MAAEDVVQDAAEAGKVITGTEETIKHIDGLAQVVVAKNLPAAILDEVEAAAEEAAVEVTQADCDNRELGSLCQVPYTVSVVGITE